MHMEAESWGIFDYVDAGPTGGTVVFEFCKHGQSRSGTAVDP